MKVIVRAPPPALAPFVASLWYVSAEGDPLPHSYERILPTGAMQVLINLGEDELRTYGLVGGGVGVGPVERRRGAAVCGAHARPFAIDTAEQREIMGVHFRPGGAHPFFSCPASALFDRHVELDQLWGRDGASLRERLGDARTPPEMLRTLEAVLLSRVKHRGAPDRAISHALAALEGDVPVAALVTRAGLSARRFIADFRAVVGLTPKRYARVRRFGRVLAAVEAGGGPRVDWAAVALDCGYFDQAHLIHDFREFAGINPGSYRARAPGEPTHVPLVP